MKILIIIPAYNEELNIGRVVDDLREYLPHTDVVVVNDGSSDGTATIAQSRGVKVLSEPFNLGIGANMQTGYLYASRQGYDVAVQFDGDGQHCADQLASLLRPLREGTADVVIGSRFLGARTQRPSWSRLFGIWVLSAAVSSVLGKRISDPTSGFRAVNRSVIDYFSGCYPDDYPEPEALVLVHRAGFRVTEVPVVMRERMGGASTITSARGIYYMVKVVLAICVDMMKIVGRCRT